MDLELPAPDQVIALLPQWRIEYPRLEALFERYQEPVKALRHMGLLLWQQGDLAVATRMLAGALALAPDQAPLWSGLGGVLFAGDHRAEAAICIKKALDRDPSLAADWLMLGTIYSTGQNTALAEDAFLNALQCDPDLPDTIISLGLLYTRTKRYEEAARCLKEAVARGIDNPTVRTCLGQSLFNLGDFPGAAEAFAGAVQRQPDDHALRQKFGQARFLETLLTGTLPDSLAAFRQAAGNEPEDKEKLIRDGFHILSGYGFRDAAIRLGEAHQVENPGDPIETYLLAALKQTPFERAPDDYLISYFDKFAESFDKQLVEVLDYHGPEKLAALLARHDRPFARILDLGCGTGLAGPLLKAPGRIMTGVDLSPRMLEKAAARGTYDNLIESEAIAYLAAQPEQSFDLIFAADFLVYVGELTFFLQQAARLLPAGGLLALTLETTDDSAFRLLPSGRFAHRLGYLEELGRATFRLLEQEPAMIRLEANRPVDGALMLFERI